MTELVVKFPKAYKLLNEPFRYKVFYGGRAAARSWTFSRKLLIRGTTKPLLILCTRELQKSIRDSVHRLLRNQIELLQLSSFYNVTDTKITGINGTEFIFLGTKHNASEIKSLEGVDICWIEEAHAITQDSWDIIDPTIRKEGSEIWISYNTRFKFDTIHKMFVVDRPPPSSLVLKTSYEKDNPYKNDVLTQQMETMKEKDYEKYLHIWAGELKTLATGAIFGKQITEVKKSNRLLRIPVEKNAQVYTFSDVGKNDPSAYWLMQKIGPEHRFIDFYQNRLEDIEHYVKVLKAFGYNYAMHFFPHDAFHNRLGMRLNIAEQFEAGGIRPVEKVQCTNDKTDAIELGRSEMSHCYFHQGDDGDKELGDCEGYVSWLPEGMQTRAQRMEKGWEILCNYRYKYDDDNDSFQQRPHHDWASHGADAYMTYAQGFREVFPTATSNQGGSHVGMY